MLIHDERQHAPHIIRRHIGPGRVYTGTNSHLKVTGYFCSNSTSAHEGAHVGGVWDVGERRSDAVPEFGLKQVEQEPVVGGDGDLGQAQ